MPNATFSQATPVSLRVDLGKASNLPVTVGAGLDLQGQMFAANRLLFPPYKLEILGKKCFYKWCTDPVVVEFDINHYFKEWFEFKIALLKTQKNIAASVPFSIEPFEQLTGVSMEDSTVLWTNGVLGEIGVSHPGLSETLAQCSLPVGTHNITANVYAPLDTSLERVLGTNSVQINVQQGGCP